MKDEIDQELQIYIYSSFVGISDGKGQDYIKPLGIFKDVDK